MADAGYEVEVEGRGVERPRILDPSLLASHPGKPPGPAIVRPMAYNAVRRATERSTNWLDVTSATVPALEKSYPVRVTTSLARDTK